MSRGRLVFSLSACGLAVLWAIIALSVSSTRFEYRNLIESIRAGEEPPSHEMLNEAISAYSSTMHIAPCNAALHADMALLLGERLDAAMVANTTNQDMAMQQTQEQIATHLSCSPTDGKAWLDFATIDIYREGFTKKALGAYKMSAEVAPGESWLAEKRLLFALQFRLLFDAGAMKIARNDLAILKLAHPNRMMQVMKMANITDEPSLYAMFATGPAVK